MAQKKITDLTLRSDADATCNFPVDDASQTWRVTLAQIKTFILAITAETVKALPLNADSILLWSAADSALRYATKSTFKSRATAAKTANYTATELDDLILCNATSGGFTITLPAAASHSGRTYVIKKTDSSGNIVIIDGNSSETIDGDTTWELGTQYEKVEILCDGSNWHIV